MPLEANPKNWDEIPEESSISNDEQIFIIKKLGNPAAGFFRRIEMSKVTAQFEAQLQQMVDAKLVTAEGYTTPVSSTSGVSLDVSTSVIHWHRVMDRVFIVVFISPSQWPGLLSYFTVSGLPFKPKKTEIYIGRSSGDLSGINDVNIIPHDASSYPGGAIMYRRGNGEAYQSNPGGIIFSGSYQIDE